MGSLHIYVLRVTPCYLAPSTVAYVLQAAQAIGQRGLSESCCGNTNEQSVHL